MYWHEIVFILVQIKYVIYGSCIQGLDPSSSSLVRYLVARVPTLPQCPSRYFFYAAHVTLSFSPTCEGSVGLVTGFGQFYKSVESEAGLLTPVAASLSASSFPRVPLCPFTHLKRVGALLFRRWYAVALSHSSFWVFVHPVSTQVLSEWFSAWMTYCESDIIVRSTFRGAFCSAIKTTASSPT